ncbi:hypothetical protein NIES25_41000 [Nostoc linckia NIES-25]|nr:hypothetical protein NIES25_41000 [Nostoc linckia NIES-25]
MTNSRNHFRTVNLCEYEQLRNEINNRTNLSASLVALQLTALGAGLSVLEKFPDVVIALAAVSSFLWLLWIDHTSQIYKIAAYIGLCLAPQLSEGNEQLLGWEHFMRTLDQGNHKAGEVLFGDSSKNLKVLKTEVIGRFISILFGGSPPVLIVGFAIAKYQEIFNWNSIFSLRGAILVLASIAWLYARNKYLLFLKMRESIDQALLEVANRHNVRKDDIYI